VAAKYILAALSVLFLGMALVRQAREGAPSRPQSRTWLLIGTIFGIVSAYLFYVE
jgi:hypothetical protein